MKNFISITLSILLITLSLHAKDSTTKTFKSNEDFFKAMAELKQKQQKAKAETKRMKQITAQKEAELQQLIKLEKTVDKVSKQLGIDK